MQGKARHAVLIQHPHEDAALSPHAHVVVAVGPVSGVGQRLEAVQLVQPHIEYVVLLRLPGVERRVGDVQRGLEVDGHPAHGVHHVGETQHVDLGVVIDGDAEHEAGRLPEGFGARISAIRGDRGMRHGRPVEGVQQVRPDLLAVHRLDLAAVREGRRRLRSDRHVGGVARETEHGHLAGLQVDGGDVHGVRAGARPHIAGVEAY